MEGQRGTAWMLDIFLYLQLGDVVYFIFCNHWGLNQKLYPCVSTSFHHHFHPATSNASMSAYTVQQGDIAWCKLSMNSVGSLWPVIHTSRSSDKCHCLTILDLICFSGCRLLSLFAPSDHPSH